MKVNDTLANTTRAAHDVGLAAWLGGSMYGKFALNPSVERIADHAERGAVANAAWNGYNVINAAGLGAAALGWGAARVTEAEQRELSPTEKGLSVTKDVLMGAAVLTGIANGIQGARLARQAPDGAVPIKSGTEPAPETPETAASIQRSLGVLGNANIGVGIALVAVNAVLSQVNYSHPPARRGLLRSSSGQASTSPLWLGTALTAAVAAVDQVRRAKTA